MIIMHVIWNKCWKIINHFVVNNRKGQKLSMNLCINSIYFRVYHHNQASFLTILYTQSKRSDMRGRTSVCEGLDVVRQVDVHTLCILHFLEDDPDEPHGYKVVPVAEKHKGFKLKLLFTFVYFMLIADQSNNYARFAPASLEMQTLLLLSKLLNIMCLSD